MSADHRVKYCNWVMPWHDPERWVGKRSWSYCSEPEGHDGPHRCCCGFVAAPVEAVPEGESDG